MKVGESVELHNDRCLSCGKEIDMAACVGEDGDYKPSPGDITVCIYCGHIMSFGEDLSMQELSDEDMRAIAGDKRILAIQDARGKVLNARNN